MKRNLQFLTFLLNVFQKNKVLSLMFLALFSLSNSNAQVATEYTFSQVSGTYISITGGTVVASGSATDDNYFAVTLPTGFSFNGANITTVGFMSDGYLAMGNNTTHGYVPISSIATSSGVIAAFGADLVAASASSEMRWQEIGNEIIFQWKEFKRYNLTPFTNESISFQIVINTATGVIKTVYNGSTTVANSSTRIPQVGLRGATNADYNARYLTTTVPDASPAWNDTAAAISNANNVRFTSGAPATYPAAGHTYVWTPTDASVDWANLQWISNTTPYTCQPVDVYTQGYEPGVTNSAGAGAGVAVWVGKMASATDSDPSTWPESAWTSATYNVDSGNNDEFKLTLSGLAAGSYRIATRWKINSGPYKYGATNNAFYNGTTSITGLVTVSAPPAITATATPSTPICAGTSVTLAASSAGSYTYSWNNGAGTGASVSVSPTATTTYTVTGTDTVSGCTNTATVTVTVNPAPPAVDITTPNTSLCADAIQTLTATGGIGFASAYTEDFSTSSGWAYGGTATGLTGAYSSTANAGGTAPEGVLQYDTTATGSWYFYPFGATTADYKAIDITNYTSLNFDFKYFFDTFSGAYTRGIYVDVSTDGTNFTNVWSNVPSGSANSSGSPSINLNSYVGNSNLYFRFRYTGDTFGMDYWYVDNIVISGNKQLPITWSPTTNLYTDAACTTAYTGTNATTVYAKPSSTITYTATATLGTCTTTDTVTLTVGTTTWAIVSPATTPSWDNGAPTSTVAAVISADYTTGGTSLDACSLTVNNNAVVVISSGDDVTLSSGSLTVASGSTYTQQNNANLIQTNADAVNSGGTIIERNSTPMNRLDYTMWSAPVSGTQTLQNFSQYTLSTRFYEYNTATDLYNSISNAGTWSMAKGYLIRVNNTWPVFPAAAVVWPGKFRGTPNNGTKTFTLSTAGNGFNAVGNPYPSALKVDDFINANSTQIDGTLWFWRKTNDTTNLTSYSTCTTAGCTLNNGHSYANADYLSVGQGFLVKAKAGATAVTFDNTMRASTNVDQFFKANNTVDRYWVSLNTSTGASFQNLYAYLPDATLNYDNGKDGIFYNDTTLASLSSVVNGVEMVIQARPSFVPTDIIPLMFKTTEAGTYTISLYQTEGVFADAQDIFIKDNLLGTTQSIKLGAYTFTSDVGVFANRFELVYQPALSVNTANFDASVQVIKQNGDIVINAGNTIISKVKVFDTRGRLLIDKKNINASEVRLASDKTQQVLLVQITSNEGKVVTKKIVN
jgi:VCBS repeat-containing protein